MNSGKHPLSKDEQDTNIHLGNLMNWFLKSIVTDFIGVRTQIEQNSVPTLVLRLKYLILYKNVYLIIHN